MASFAVPVVFQANICDTAQKIPPNPTTITLAPGELTAFATGSAPPGDNGVSILLQTFYLVPGAAQRIGNQLGASVPCPTEILEYNLPPVPSLTPFGTKASVTTSSRIISQSGTIATASSPSDTSTSITVAPKPTSKGSNEKKTNPGAIAGGIVGGVVLGILVGAAILFLLGFRRRKGHATTRGPPESAYGYSEGKTGVSSSTTMSIPMESAAAIVERNLPDPIADNDIHSEFSKVDDKINGHVNSFYSQSHATDHFATAQAIAPLLGSGSSVTLQKINALLANTQTRASALRFALAKIITSRMDPDGASPNALLPFGTAATLRGMPKVQTNDPTRLAFMTKWRAITAYLMGIPSNTNTVSEESIRQTVLDCDAIVGPYATPTMEQQTRLQNLEEICRRAGRVSGMLFSQQAVYRFDWSQAGPGLVVFPGLVKITNETGGVLQTPMVFAEKKVVQV